MAGDSSMEHSLDETVPLIKKPVRDPTAYVFSAEIPNANLIHETFPCILDRAFRKVLLMICYFQTIDCLLSLTILNNVQESAYIKGGKIRHQTAAKIADEMVTKGSCAKDAEYDLLPKDNFFFKNGEKETEAKTLLYLDLRLLHDKLYQHNAKLLALQLEEFFYCKQAPHPDEPVMDLLAKMHEPPDEPFLDLQPEKHEPFDEVFVDLQAEKHGPLGCQYEQLDRLLPIATQIFGNAGQFVLSTIGDRMRFEGFRLGSFVHLNNVDHPTAIRLANAGFFFAFEGGQVMQCFSCGFRWEDWQPGQDPYDPARHHAGCKHIQGRDERNVPIHPRQTSFQSGTDITGDASTDNSIVETCSRSRQTLQESLRKFTDDIACCRPSAPAVHLGNEGDNQSRTNTPEGVSVLGQATGVSGVTSASVTASSVRSNADDGDFQSHANGSDPHDDNLQLRNQGAEQLLGLSAAEENDFLLFAHSGLGADNSGFPSPTTNIGGSESSFNQSPGAARDTHPPTLQRVFQESNESLTVADRATEHRQNLDGQRAFEHYNRWMERQAVDIVTEDLETRNNATEESPRSDLDRGMLGRDLSGFLNFSPNLMRGLNNRQNINMLRFSYSGSAQSSLSAGNMSADIAGFLRSPRVNNIAGSRAQMSTSNLPISTSEMLSEGSDRRLPGTRSEVFSSLSRPIVNYAGLPMSSFAQLPVYTNASTSSDRQTASTSASAAIPPQPAGATGGSASFNPAGAVYPRYAERSSRMESFRNWPPHLTQVPEELADCGFFFTGTDDCVRCFYCGLGLKSWDQGDDPEDEHERWRGTCAFILFRREQELAAWRRALSVEVQQEPLTAPRSLSENQGETVSTSQGDANLMTSDQAARAFQGSLPDRDWTNARAVQAARDMGFQSDVIQEGILALLGTRAGPRAVTPQNLINAILFLRERSERDRQSDSRGRQSPDWRLGDFQDNLQLSGSDSGDSRDDEISNNPELPTGVDTGPGSDDTTAHVFNNAAAAGPYQGGKLRTSNDDIICSNSNADLNDTSPRNEDADVLRRLEAENKELVERHRCKVCLDADINVLLLPCAHRVCCSDCVLRLRRCPLCRTRIQNVVRVR